MCFVELVCKYIFWYQWKAHSLVSILCHFCEIIISQVGNVHIKQLRGVFVASHYVINLHLIIEL